MSQNITKKEVSKKLILDDQNVTKGHELAIGISNLKQHSSSSPIIATNIKGEKFVIQAVNFVGCFLGLQVSFITWGLMQELIMKTQYLSSPNIPSGKFPSVTFCVFSNRLLTLIISAIICYYKYGTIGNTSLSFLEFTPCALSNTLSSWSQYAALRYVSFPVQNIFKSLKVLPVMIMGIIVSNKSYTIMEYVEGTAITLGVFIFSLPNHTKGYHSFNHQDFFGLRINELNQIYGLLLLGFYVLTDCFTSQWQSKLFIKNPKLDQYQMMHGVNLSSIIITSFGLIASGDIPLLIEFFTYNPRAFLYNIIASITSATGQFFIFLTIKKFGPTVFTIIMTTRQIFSMVLSVLLFHHSFSLLSYIGAIIVFSVIFYSIFRRYLNSEDS